MEPLDRGVFLLRLYSPLVIAAIGRIAAANIESPCSEAPLPSVLDEDVDVQLVRGARREIR